MAEKLPENSGLNGCVILCAAWSALFFVPLGAGGLFCSGEGFYVQWNCSVRLGFRVSLWRQCT
ncbi:hypothetical protein, partial [Atlantibacter sp.]|uniref:hypothetical protein n=1 Tax=Atlantibacter sp. TaxID=1903473 RepID=UPI0028A78A39